jgi:nucleoside-diphosphate-sugar epimerase
MQAIQNSAKSTLPQIIVTGASEFLGRNFINQFKENFRIIAVADKSQAETGIPKHSNITWISKDISTIECIEDFAADIINGDAIECLAHFAINSSRFGFNKNKFKKNFAGIQNMLELARLINVRHFLFTSSLEVYKYSKDNSRIIYEDTKPDATDLFGSSLLKCEELVKKHSKYFKCSIVRQASVYSDWCENKSLFQFLNGSLSENLSSHFIAGKGNTAETYIHIIDMASLINKIISNEKNLSSENYFIAGNPCAVSEKELLEVLTIHNNAPGNLIHVSEKVSKIIAAIKKITNSKKDATYFPEIHKIDKRIEIDNRLTRQLLQWKPTRRYDLLRRIFVLIDKRKQNPDEWLRRNEASKCKTIYKNSPYPSLNFEFSKDLLLKKITEIVQDPFNGPRFKFLQTLNKSILAEELEKLILALQESVISSDNMFMYDYSEKTAQTLFQYDAEVQEYRFLMNSLNSILREAQIYSLSNHKDERKLNKIAFLLQLCADKAEDYFERLQTEKNKNSRIVTGMKQIKTDEFTALRNHLKNQAFPTGLRHDPAAKIFMN